VWLSSIRQYKTQKTIDYIHGFSDNEFHKVKRKKQVRKGREEKRNEEKEKRNDERNKVRKNNKKKGERHEERKKELLQKEITIPTEGICNSVRCSDSYMRMSLNWKCQE
jgi:spore cortex formation protein SpoVR/YcgB (stage V sporulation)